MRGVKGHFKVWGPTITWRDDGAVYWERKYWRGAGLSEGKVFSSVQFSRSVVSESVTPWIAACQASLSITNTRSPPKPMSIELVMPSNHLLLCHPLLLLPSNFPRIRVFSNDSALHISWPKYWSFSNSPSSEYSGLISFTIDWFISFLSKRLSRVFSNTTVQKHQFFGAQPSSQSNSHIHTWPQEKP